MERFPINDLYNYACNKFYRVIYNDIYCDERVIKGLLLNCHGPFFVLLCEKGMYYIRHKDVLLMEPIPMTFRMSEEYRSVVEAYLAKCAAQE